MALHKFWLGKTPGLLQAKIQGHCHLIWSWGYDQSWSTIRAVIWVVAWDAITGTAVNRAIVVLTSASAQPPVPAARTDGSNGRILSPCAAYKFKALDRVVVYDDRVSWLPEVSIFGNQFFPSPLHTFNHNSAFVAGVLPAEG